MHIIPPQGHLLLATGDPVHTVLTYFFLAISNIGGQDFYFLVIPYLIWGRDKRLGVETALLLITSSYLNLYLKEWFKVPRPPKDQWAPGVDVESYSFPSGHAQSAATFWTYLSVRLRKNWVIVTGLVLTVLICYSRIFLGVHRWNDIFVGLGLGVVIALAFLLLRGPATRLLGKMDHVQRLSLAVAVPIILFLLTRSVDYAHLLGFLLGVLAGAELEATNLGMPDPKDGPQRWKRLIIGYPLCGAIMFGLGHFGPTNTGWQFIVYTLAGMGITFFSPAIFSRYEKWN